jgi:hypothetical protein
VSKDAHFIYFGVEHTPSPEGNTPRRSRTSKTFLDVSGRRDEKEIKERRKDKTREKGAPHEAHALNGAAPLLHSI